MKKIEIFDTISFTPFGTLACPSTLTMLYPIYVLDDFNLPFLPLCAFMSSVPLSFEKIK